ncbi:MAG: GspE/PulE family protein [Candidatus Magasanikbacteria bacterium]
MIAFASIDDLKKGKGTGTGSTTGLSVSSDEVDEKFQKKMGQISLHEKEREAFRFASEIGFPHIDLEKFPISQEALRQLPKERAKEIGAACFFSAQDEVRVAALDPRTEEVKDFLHSLKERNHANGALYLISKKSFERVMRLYETLPVVKPITKDIEIKPEELARVQADVHDFRTFGDMLQKASTTNLVTYILAASLKLNASDVHVEPEEEKIVIRFRLDGILHDAAEVPKTMYKQLMNRVKLVSSLKINITEKPQDGRFSIRLPEGDVDVRVSIMPTVFGEGIVMRLLKQSREGLSLDGLGLQGSALDILKGQIERPNGMIITTGPTGSGKTTTMYAVLQILNKPGVKIITLEDPVEYRIEGINQSQIDRSRDYTFAKGLKSILRQDPDIAMVGEIRDLETADIAIQAALTGHLMLSTIHTNNAAGAIPRFLSMGVKPFLLAPALNCVIGQRLVRRLCQTCKKEHVLTENEKKRVHETVERMPDVAKAIIAKKELAFFGSGGCAECSDIGFKGRVGIYEIFVMDEEIEQMILSGKVAEFEMEKIAVSHGMISMVQDGILKALEGLTAVEEVFRVIE